MGEEPDPIFQDLNNALISIRTKQTMQLALKKVPINNKQMMH